MKDQVTSIEQSRRLLELGVPAEKASMVRIFEDCDGDVLDWDYVVERDGKFFMSEFAMDSFAIDSDGPVEVYHQLYDANNGEYDHSYRSDHPAFTVADLLMMLPPKISWQDPSDGNFRMRRYRGEDGIEWVIDYDRFVFGRISIIDTLVETIECLVANGYKLEV